MEGDGAREYYRRWMRQYRRSRPEYVRNQKRKEKLSRRYLRVLSASEIQKMQAVAETGASLQRIRWSIGFHSGEDALRHCLKISGYRLVRCLMERKGVLKYQTTMRKFRPAELAMIQEKLLDCGWSDRETGRWAGEVFGPWVDTHEKFIKALRRSGYTTRWGIEPLPSAGGIPTIEELTQEEGDNNDE